MGGHSKSQVTGYKYWGAMHLVLCHAGVEAIDRMRVADKTISTDVLHRGNSVKLIYDWERFGGDKREGGPVGLVKIMFGDDDQGLNTMLEMINPTGVGYRGVVSVVMPKMYFSANNPYIKPWSFRVQSYPSTGGLSDAKKKILIPSTALYNMNPAHIIYAVLVGRGDRWGLGLSPFEDIDLASFESAAKLLFDEGFGVGISWENNSGVDDFIKEILRHVDGAIFVDQTSGKLKLKLFRGDYNLEDLPIVNNKVVTEVEKFTYPQWGNIPTQVTVSYVDYQEGKDRPVTVHNMAARNIQGRDIPMDVKFPGINNIELATKVASRELSQRSRRLATGTLLCNRLASSYNVGDVVIVELPERRIDSRVMRVLEREYVSELKQTVRLTLVDDVFKTVPSIISSTGGSQWLPPVNTPLPALAQLLIEAPYWEIAMLSDVSGVNVSQLSPTAAFVRLMASGANGIGYDVLTGTTNEAVEYTKTGSSQFLASAELLTTLSASTPDTLAITITNITDANLILVNQPILVGNEFCWLTNYDSINQTIKVTRGIHDTVPMDHPAGTKLWFYGDLSQGVAEEEFLIGQTVYARALTKTLDKRLGFTDAAFSNVSCVGRAFKPYPPAGLSIDGAYLPNQAKGDFLLTWKGRNRLVQTDKIPLAQVDAGIPVEDGVTYTLTLSNKTTGDVIQLRPDLEGGQYQAAFMMGIYKLKLADKLRIQLYAAKEYDGDVVNSYTGWDHSCDWIGPDTAPETETPEAGQTLTSYPQTVTSINLYHADAEALYLLPVTTEDLALGDLKLELTNTSTPAGSATVQVQYAAIPTDGDNLLNVSGSLPLSGTVTATEVGNYYIKISNSSAFAGASLKVFPAVNQSPVVTPATVIVYVDKPQLIGLLDFITDADGDTLTIVSATAAKGLVTLTGANALFSATLTDFSTLAEGDSENVDLTVVVSDGVNPDVTGIITIAVTRRVNLFTGWVNGWFSTATDFIPTANARTTNWFLADSTGYVTARPTVSTDVFNRRRYQQRVTIDNDTGAIYGGEGFPDWPVAPRENTVQLRLYLIQDISLYPGATAQIYATPWRTDTTGLGNLNTMPAESGFIWQTQTNLEPQAGAWTTAWMNIDTNMGNYFLIEGTRNRFRYQYKNAAGTIFYGSEVYDVQGLHLPYSAVALRIYYSNIAGDAPAPSIGDFKVYQY